MYRVVLDTNIVVSGHLKVQSLPRMAFKAAILREYAQLYVTHSILEEYERVLRYPKFKFLIEDADTILTIIKEHSKFIRPKKAPGHLILDPTDAKFLECALGATADFIVTGDKRGYAFKEYEEIKLLSPREFLGELGLGFWLEISN